MLPLFQISSESFSFPFLLFVATLLSLKYKWKGIVLIPKFPILHLAFRINRCWRWRKICSWPISIFWRFICRF